jgi:hypothetical protein
MIAKYCTLKMHDRCKAVTCTCQCHLEKRLARLRSVPQRDAVIA